MGSNGKKKTTWAKLNREQRLREKREEKQARRDARKQAAAENRDAPVETVAADDLFEMPRPST